MQAALAKKIENIVVQAASALFGAACGYAAFALLLRELSVNGAVAAAAVAAATSFVGCRRVLHLLNGGEGPLASASFPLTDYDPEPLEELLLTDRYDAEPSGPEPLELDDILAELGPDSRVVRLFDPAAMPTPAQLKSRIDAHLNRDPVQAPALDASEALHEALAELRRSMR